MTFRQRLAKALTNVGQIERGLFDPAGDRDAWDEVDRQREVRDRADADGHVATYQPPPAPPIRSSEGPR